jgi:hypothetical protein
MAKLVTNGLLKLIKEHEGRLRKQWGDSPYAREVTYQEYFIWWYHLFYTAVTDRLIARGEITKPRTDVFTYLLVQ